MCKRSGVVSSCSYRVVGSGFPEVCRNGQLHFCENIDRKKGTPMGIPFRYKPINGINPF